VLSSRGPAIVGSDEPEDKLPTCHVGDTYWMFFLPAGIGTISLRFVDL